MRLLYLGALLAAGILTAASPSASAAAGSNAPAYVRLDLDLGALHLSTFTDTLPGEAATAFHARAGDMVRRVYVVRNEGLLPLIEVSVHDPDVSASAIRCASDADDDGDDTDLGPLSWMSCSATFRASSGEHVSRVTATAVSAIFRRTLSATAPAGYTAIAPGLSATVTFDNGVPQGGNLPAAAAVGARVRIENSGSATLIGLRVTPPASLSGLGCPAGSAIGSLGPGESALCSGSLTTAAGRHEDALIVTGAWRWDSAIDAQGPQPARSYPIQATASVAYNGIARPRPSPPPTPTPPPRANSPAAPVPPVVPSPPPPPTSASPTPSPSNSPAAPPVEPLPQATVRFVPSRGLSLPEKVLVVVIIPGAVAARRIVSRK